MCAISAAIIKSPNHKYWDLLVNSEIRGQDGTGYIVKKGQGKRVHYIVQRSDKKASEAHLETELEPGDMIMGQNRLAIFGLDHSNDQPLVTNNTALVHNGNLLDFESRFSELGLEREWKVDSELILRLWEKYRDTDDLFRILQGNYAVIIFDRIGHGGKARFVAFTNYKPLYYFEDETGFYFYSTGRIGKRTFGVEGTPLNNREVLIKSV